MDGVRVRGEHQFNERLRNVYDGEYSADGRLRHGQGTMTYSDGSTCVRGSAGDFVARFVCLLVSWLVG